MADASYDDGPSCGVCMNPFDSEERKPWDLGCGHSYCEACLREHPRSFRNCPECRARASMPHVNISLLRLLGSRPSPSPSAPPLETGGARGPVTRQRSRQQQPTQQQGRAASAAQQEREQRRAREAIPELILGSAGASTGTTRANARHGGNPIAVAAALAATVQQALGQRRATGAAHQHPEVAAWKASIWTWLGPLLALLYILSPLDAIPDFLPLIGWVDDILVALYLVSAIWGRTARRGQAAGR